MASRPSVRLLIVKYFDSIVNYTGVRNRPTASAKPRTAAKPVTSTASAKDIKRSEGA